MSQTFSPPISNTNNSIGNHINTVTEKPDIFMRGLEKAKLTDSVSWTWLSHCQIQFIAQKTHYITHSDVRGNGPSVSWRSMVSQWTDTKQRRKICFNFHPLWKIEAQTSRREAMHCSAGTVICSRSWHGAKIMGEAGLFTYYSFCQTATEMACSPVLHFYLQCRHN